MGQAMPPVGRREYDEDRAEILAWVRGHGPCTVQDIRDHVSRRAGVMAAWHLVILGDRGQVMWLNDLVEAVPS